MSFWKDLGQFVWRDDAGAISPTRFFSVVSQVMLLVMVVLAYFHFEVALVYWVILCGLTGNRSLIWLVSHLTTHFKEINAQKTVKVPDVTDLVDKG